MQATEAAVLNYISILEKTNQQFAYWNSQNGNIVSSLSSLLTALGILVGLLAIGVAFVLWKNSKEQRDLVVDFFDKQEKEIKRINQQNDARVKSYSEKLDNLIGEYKKQLKSANKKDIQNKKMIKKAIDELQREKAGIGLYATSSPSASAYSVPTSAASISFSPGVSGSTTTTTTSSSTLIQCKRCGLFFAPSQSLTGLKTCPYCNFPY